MICGGTCAEFVQIPGLTSGFQYYARVSTKNNLGYSPSSDTVNSATIDSIPVFTSESLSCLMPNTSTNSRITVAVSSFDEFKQLQHQ